MEDLSVGALGYIELGVKSLADWKPYAESVLGVSCLEQDDALLLRFDSEAWRVRLVQTGEEDIVCAGFSTDSIADLKSICDRVQSLGYTVSEATKAEAEARGVESLMVCHDPDGLRVELYTGDRSINATFTSALNTGPFVTGDMGLGHIVVSVSRLDKAEEFYLQGLGFKLSDHIVVGPAKQQLKLTFLHCNPRHHTLALIPVPLPTRLNHIMLQVEKFDDVGYGFDRAQQAKVKISSGLGKHPNDEMFSFYMQTPSGFDIEYGWGGLEVDDATWQPVIYDKTSIWGHKPPN